MQMGSLENNEKPFSKAHCMGHVVSELNLETGSGRLLKA